jgi:cell division protein FtsB
LSQAANTFWVNRSGFSSKEDQLAKRQVRFRHFIDGLVLMIILAATATCISVYLRTRAELGAATVRHGAAADQVEELRLQAERLEREVGRMRSDARMIESFARQDLGFVRSGEVVIKIESNQKAKATTVARARAEAQSLTPQTVESYTGASH